MNDLEHFSEINRLDVPTDNYKDILHKIFKGILGNIPIGGSIISEIFGSILSEPISKRKEQWMKLVVDKLYELELRNQGFIESLKENEEFHSYILYISQIAIKTHQEDKIKILKNTIENFLTFDTIEYDRKFSFVRIIEESTPSHIKTLLFISKHQETINQEINGFTKLYNLYSESNSIDKYYFRKCVNDLSNQSLIRINNDFYDYFGNGGYYTSDEGSPNIKVLSLGEEFINFIKDN